MASLESAHTILSSEKLHLTEEVARRDELVLRLKEEVRLLEMRYVRTNVGGYECKMYSATCFVHTYVRES